MKKSISTALIIAMLMGMLALCNFAAFATESDQLIYDYDTQNKTATVTGFEYQTAHVKIPKTVKYGGENYTVTAIGDCAFYEDAYNFPNKVFKSFELPDTLKSIDTCAFMGCTELKSLNIPESVTVIGDMAFVESGIESISFPSSLTRLGSETLSDTPLYNNRSKWQNGVLYVGDVLVAGDLNKDHDVLRIKDGCRLIADSAFYNHSGIDKIAFPGTVEIIGESAFAFTDISVISLPKSVKSVGELAFMDSGLETVHYSGTPADAEAISIGSLNEPLTDASWLYRSVDSALMFSDVAYSAWYKVYIDYAVICGIFGGKGQNRFEPNANITRAEFVQVLANLAGADLAPYKTKANFSDVKESQWFSGAVNWAYENGIVSGTGAGRFSPSAKITREQMCVMLVNFANFKNIALGTISDKLFTDDNSISSWAKNAVYRCYGCGLVSGKGEGRFDPAGNAIRAEAATVFTNFHKTYM